MEQIAKLYLIIAGLFVLVFIAWRWVMLYQGRTSYRNIFRYSIFCLVSSVIVYGSGYYAIEAAKIAQKEYVARVFKAEFDLSDPSQATESQIMDFAGSFHSREDRFIPIRFLLERAAAGFLMYFATIFLTAIGIWSLQKYLSKIYVYRMKPNESLQLMPAAPLQSSLGVSSLINLGE